MLIKCLIFALWLWVAQASPVVSDVMLPYMNVTADPCDDFYEFACGKWKTQHPSKTIRKAMGEFDGQITQLLSTVNENDGESVEKVKKFYKSCLRLPTLKPADYSRKLLEVANEFGSIPALDRYWREENFDWAQTVADIAHKYGIKIIFGYAIVNDHQNHSAHQMVISSQHFTMDHLDRKDHELNWINTLKDFGNFPSEEIERIARDMIDFETILWEGQLKNNGNDIVNSRTTIEDIHNKYYPALDFKKFMATAYGSLYPETVILKMPKYMDSVVEAIKRTPKAVVANYIFLNLVTNLRIAIPDSKPALESMCTFMVEHHFPQVVSAMFYKAGNYDEKVQAIQSMFENIKTAAKIVKVANEKKKTKFLVNSWEYAFNKLDLMQLKIASYEKHNFDQQYQQLQVNDNDLLENWKSLLAFKALKNRESFEMPPNFMDYWLNLHAIATSFETNTIIVPVSVLQSDYFWSTHRPHALNAATLGVLMAREVIDGIIGRGVEKRNGHDFPQYWRKRDIVLNAEYDERKTCFNEQYGEFRIEDASSVRSVFTPPPNYVSDNGGLFLTYDAYQRWYDNETETLPNINYTPKQLFFISYAQQKCDDVLDSLAGGYVPRKYLVNIPLWNSEAFSTEFNCPAGSSSMNPVKKCEMF